jgi:hypothetical protein
MALDTSAITGAPVDPNVVSSIVQLIVDAFVASVFARQYAVLEGVSRNPPAELRVSLRRTNLRNGRSDPVRLSGGIPRPLS